MKMIQLVLPARDWELFKETLAMDAQSASFDLKLRKRLWAALQRVRVDLRYTISSEDQLSPDKRVAVKAVSPKAERRARQLLTAVRNSCIEALVGDWDRTDAGFEDMLDCLDEAVAELGLAWTRDFKERPE